MLDYLQFVTRELKFDWVRISDHMRDHLGSCSHVPVDPATCRLLFARDYRFDASVVSSTTSGVKVEEDPPSSASNTAQSGQQKNFENMSLEELISHVDSTEQAMKRQKEDIFRRVMNSLGIEGGSSPNALSVSDSGVREAYEEGIALRELERSKKLQHQAELEERRRLEAEREALRRRFDRDEDPPALDSRTALEAAGMDDGKTSKLATTSHDVPSTYDPSVGQALTSYFETEEFEAILSQLERELDRMAVAKDEGLRCAGSCAGLFMR